MMKLCIACGMPMEVQDDFAMGDTSKDYCCHCARPDGSMQSYEEKKKNLTQFVQQMQGLEKNAAQAVAETMMKDLPAWRDM